MEKLVGSDMVPYYSCEKKSLARIKTLVFFLTLFINDASFGSVVFLLPKHRTDFPSSLLDSVLKSHLLLDR